CHNNIPIHRFQFLNALHHRDLYQLVETRRVLAAFKRQFCPDLVHIHFSGPSGLFHWQTQGAHPARTLLSLHSLPMQEHDSAKSLVTTTVKKADWVTGASAHILRQVPSDPARASVIYNGISPPSVAPQPLPNAPVLLCIGRMVAWKRFDWAIDLFAEISCDYPTARLVLVGNGAARAALVEQVRQRGLQGRVTFTGMLSQEETAAQIAQSTLVLLPSTSMENIPYVAVETGWLARPVIASDVSGLPEIIVDGETGYLVPPTDKAAWLARIAQLLDNPQQTQRMGEQARVHVAHRFALRHCAAQYEALYRQIITDSDA
ncbi:MAG: glycosyltransferase family 4 protein, partial [Caldilineaceae bacterium]|nr:glycosyltransferase family 4 protein [Caldilineaceae bacterium]